MHIVVLGQEARYQAYRPAMPFLDRQTPAFLDKDSTEAEIAAASPEAEVLFVDAITPVTASLMDRLPKLRLIHSEGVAYDRIDLDAARQRNIYVCNNKGCNAGAVAEQAILLMLMLLRHALPGDRAVRAGRQMEMKERYMVEGITELSACKVGLVGFGDIGRATAERLAPFGCELYYYTKHRRTPEEERKYGVTYLPLEELAAAFEDAKKVKNRPVLFDIKVLPKTMTDGYGSWWRVGDTEVSERPENLAAYQDYLDHVKDARKY